MWYPGIRYERKWRQREEMGGKNLPTKAKNCVFFLHKIRFEMDQIGPKMDQNGAMNRVFVPKIPFFWGHFVCGTHAFGGNNPE